MTTEAVVKADVQNVTKFYDQLRLFGAVNSGINNQNGTALTNLAAQQVVCSSAFVGDFVTQKNGALAGSRATVASVLASDVGAAGRWVLRDWAQYLNVPETDSLGILKRVYDDFNANAKRVASRGFTFGTITAGSNQGNGVGVRLNVDENGYVLENQTADAKSARCVQDGTSGSEVWEEVFEVRGQAQAIDTLAVTGSGRKTNIAALSAKSSAALIRNPSFSQTTPAGPSTSLTDITNWTSTQTVSTTFYDSIGSTGVNGYYRGFPGDTTPLAIRFKSNGTTGTFSLSQNLETNRARFVRTTPYLVQAAWRRKSSATGTAYLSLGNQTASVDVSTGTNDVWNTLRFTGTACWFKNMDKAGLLLTVGVTTLATGNVDFDDVLVCPMTAFDGGWYAFVGTPATTTPSQWLLDDTFTWTDTELGETYGTIQKIFLWRGFGVYLPAIPKAPSTAPSAALAGAGAGSVENGQHFYRVTFVDGNSQESGLSSSGTATVVDKTSDGKVALTAIPTGPTGTASRKVYRTIAAAADSVGNFKLLTTVTGNVTTTFTDSVADASLGATATAAVQAGITLADPT